MARNFGGGKRMAKHWHSLGSNILNATSADVTGLVANFLSDDEPFTVLRILGSWGYGPGVVNVINDTAALTYAIGVFSSDAVAVGGTAVPDPEDEPGYPWLYYKSVLFEQTIAAQDSGGDPRISRFFDINVKSMRKIKPRESLAIVFQFRDINGALLVHFNAECCRVLVAK